MKVTDGQSDSGVELIEHRASSDRLVAQRTLFTGTSPVASDELYAVTKVGMSTRSRFELRLQPGAVAHTNTFFGRFPASYWQRWTPVTEVTVTARVVAETACRIQIQASDIGGHRRIVTNVVVTGTEQISMTAPLDTFVDGGALWLQFEAQGGGAVVDDVEWSVVSPKLIRPVAVAICTFNRADDCARTVEALASDERVLGLLDALYVVDQGTDPVESRELFQEVSKKFGSRLQYLRQANLGGAGGFTRGLYEASEAGPHSDVILMDDDILCEPESVLRLSAFANMTTEPALIGAQMLFLFNPDYLLASGERVDLGTLQRGVPTDEHGVRNRSVLEKLPERRVDAEYNGWWSCLIPAEAIERIGLPLPVFFQWDDVEYSLRAGRAGIPTITLPSAAVWHADFYWKDVDGFAHYFSTRNGLITAALDPGFAPKTLAKQMARDISHSIVGLQYGLAHTQIRAIEGFLEGPAGLADGGQKALATINQERKRFPETVTRPASELPGRLPIRRVAPSPKTGLWTDLVLAKRAVMQARNQLERGPVAISYEDAQWWHVGRFDHVFVTDASQGGVRERRFDSETAAEMSGRLAGVIKRFLAEAPSVAEAFAREFPQLTSRENWARLYEK